MEKEIEMRLIIIMNYTYLLFLWYYLLSILYYTIINFEFYSTCTTKQININN